MSCTSDHFEVTGPQIVQKFADDNPTMGMVSSMENGAANKQAKPNDDVNASATTSLLLDERPTKPTVSMMEATDVDPLLVRASIITVTLWVALLSLIFTASPPEHWQSTQGLEQQVPFVASVVSTAVLVYFLLPFIAHISSEENKRKKKLSGIMIAAICTSLISIVTNILLSSFPTIVVQDSFTGVRVFAVRWCEFIPLAGLMTYMADAIDMEKDLPKIGNRSKFLQTSTFHAMAEVISTSSGLLFPYCTNFATWCFFMLTAMAFFLPIFYQVHHKHQLLLNTPKGATFKEQDIYNRRYFAYRLILMCSQVWSVLVTTYCLNVAAHMFLPENHAWRQSDAAMCVDTAFDVLAKGFYLKVIVQVHQEVFDNNNSRVERQLVELQHLIRVLWASTTDTIVISVRERGGTSSVLSPSFESSLLDMESINCVKSQNAPGIFLEHSSTSNEETTLKIESASYIDAHKISSSRHDKEDAMERIAPLSTTSLQAEVATSLIQACWEHWNEEQRSASPEMMIKESKSLVVEEFIRSNGEKCYCELKLSWQQDSFVAIVRDVTERVKRLEAEQRAATEAEARQRDAQSVNRFTRHEIKNGLLSGIELNNRLQKSFQLASDSMDSKLRKLLGDNYSRDEQTRFVEAEITKTQGMMGQVDRVLQEVLTTVLAEAMARDVINEIYKPSPQKIDLVEFLQSAGTGVGTEDRFPLSVTSLRAQQISYDELPKLILDGQLLKYIVRNAISNASKYGKHAGVISTYVHYDEMRELLNIQIINEPGPGHDRLLEMGDNASELVFKQSTRLHSGTGVEDNNVLLSSGDGAWIMQKCAKTMGGHCGISFEPTKTKFSFSCPAPKAQVNSENNSSPFKLPPKTFGIGIDDSWIQRKLLLRLLSNLGIMSDRIRVIGKTLDELNCLEGIIMNILEEDADNRILMLVDENLDYLDDEANRIIRSGSKTIQSLFQKLPRTYEARILCMVRSANDSAKDVAIYTERTHGFFPKTATKKEDAMELLEPIWVKRFANSSDSSSNSNAFLSSETEHDSISKADLMEVVSSVDTLLKGRRFQDIPWPHLWSALHSLKGDILIFDNELLVQAAKEINDMRGSQAPSDFDVQWRAIRRNVIQGMKYL